VSVGDRPPLLDDAALESSSVVANCAMNRERQLSGVNSYTRSLGFNPLDVVTGRLAGGHTGWPDSGGSVGWLDLCCGSGRALAQAAWAVQRDGLAGRVRLVGVDLIDGFDAAPTVPGLELVAASVTSWTPDRAFDLITCVHGLHYIGDKLAVLTRAASWLSDTGLLIADLDLASIRLPDGRPAGRRLTAQLRASGLSYDPRRHTVACRGARTVALPYTYLGADDRAGANYTGQPAVHSYYRPNPNTA
jgi:SAM-dependent methyltransferase